MKIRYWREIFYLLYLLPNIFRNVLTLNNEYIKLIFGLKLKNIRQAKGLSLSVLAKKCGISVSYLNEIESGKKYPKSDKIAALANVLGVSYDKLVSLRLSNKLAPITELISSGILEKLPLEHYGLDVRKIITLMSDAPTQLSALIATLIDLAKTSELRQNIFSRTALRTFKELNDNYFEEIETQAENFRNEFCTVNSKTVDYKKIIQFLKENYNYEIDARQLAENEILSSLRAVLKINENPKLYLNPKLSEAQKKFILGKEIYYVINNIKERAFIHSDRNLETFDELLNNYKASYFATALSINKKYLLEDLSDFFSNKKFEKKQLAKLINEYNVSPEMFFQRIANIATNLMDFPGLFFMRFNTDVNSEIYKLSKEVKLNISHYPGGYQTNEHYCRRWISIRALQKAKEKLRANPNSQAFTIDAVRSQFYETNEKFIAITIAKPSKLSRGKLTSVTLGFPLNDKVKEIIKFWNDSKIKKQVVNDTCESCPIKNCDVRAAKPTTILSKEKERLIKSALDNLN